MSDIERRSCIRFIEWRGRREYTDHDDYVFIQKTTRCSSTVGRAFIGEQALQLSVGCLSTIGEVQHELLHALGLLHEQNRMDRDDYVFVYWNHIHPGLLAVVLLLLFTLILFNVKINLIHNISLIQKLN